MDETDTHYELNFDPNIEANMFRTVPDHLDSYYGKLKCPATIVTGEQTDVCVPLMRNRFIKGNKMDHQILPGGHMFPFEKPVTVANKIAEIIEAR